MLKRKKDAPAPKGGWIATCGLIESTLDRFGWPGALLIFFIYFILKYATPEQKISMIDLFVLGKGIQIGYPIFVIGGVGLLAFLLSAFGTSRRLNC